MMMHPTETILFVKFWYHRLSLDDEAPSVSHVMVEKAAQATMARLEKAIRISSESICTIRHEMYSLKKVIGFPSAQCASEGNWVDWVPHCAC